MTLEEFSGLRDRAISKLHSLDDGSYLKEELSTKSNELNTLIDQMYSAGVSAYTWVKDAQDRIADKDLDSVYNKLKDNGCNITLTQADEIDKSDVSVKDVPKQLSDEYMDAAINLVLSKRQLESSLVDFCKYDNKLHGNGYLSRAVYFVENVLSEIEDYNEEV